MFFQQLYDTGMLLTKDYNGEGGRLLKYKYSIEAARWAGELPSKGDNYLCFNDKGRYSFLVCQVRHSRNRINPLAPTFTSFDVRNEGNKHLEWRSRPKSPVKARSPFRSKCASFSACVRAISWWGQSVFSKYPGIGPGRQGIIQWIKELRGR